MTILVVEDVHWADEATLDVLGYLARRIAELPAVLVLTYRDDELTREHPFSAARPGIRLGSGPSAAVAAPVEDAVRWLSATSRVDADEVFAMTSGNPFFVTEVLAAGDGDRVPSTVVDAVLARCVAWMRPARMRSTSSPRFRPWWSGGWSMPWYRAGWPRWWRPRSTGCSPVAGLGGVPARARPAGGGGLGGGGATGGAAPAGAPRAGRARGCRPVAHRPPRGSGRRHRRDRRLRAGSGPGRGRRRRPP